MADTHAAGGNLAGGNLAGDNLVGDNHAVVDRHQVQEGSLVAGNPQLLVGIQSAVLAYVQLQVHEPCLKKNLCPGTLHNYHAFPFLLPFFH